MKRLISLILLLLIVCQSLVGCFTYGDGTGDGEGDGAEDNSGGGEGNGSVDYGDATVYKSGDSVAVIIGDYADTGSFAELVTLFDDMGINAYYGTIYSNEVELEILAGRVSDRPIVEHAYGLMEKMERKGIFDSRYLIYADSGKIAIAFDGNEYTGIQPLPYFIEDFVAEYVRDKEYFATASGILAKGYVDLIAEQELLDEALLAKEWAKLEAVTSPEIADAFRTLYSMYGDDIPTWVAGLYDPGVGGFYASTAGRDGAQYGPDLQCTVQLLRFIASSGMVDEVGKSWTAFLPEVMQQQMICFAKSLQDKNGYFYHPQWGKELTDTRLSRRGRDLGWGVNLLRGLDSSPVYDTPNGYKGDGISADEYWASLDNGQPMPYSSLNSPRADDYVARAVQPITTSVATAVSKVVAAADDSTAYLKSHQAFIAYILDKVVPGMRSGPYSMGNTLNATYSQIATASAQLGPYTYSAGDEERFRPFDGLTLKQITVKALNECINPEIGMWGNLIPSKPLGTEFYYINGFFKVITIYNSWGVGYPPQYITKVAEALMQSLMGDEPSTGNICEVYNVWVAVSSLKSNLSFISGANYATDSDGNVIVDESGNPVLLVTYISSEVRKTLKNNTAAAVINTYEKIKGYQKSDGGFAHSYYKGTSAHQGLAVSNGANISDVDATCIGSTGLVRSIMDALGLSSYKVSMYTKSDWMRMLDIFLTKEPVVKHYYS